MPLYDDEDDDLLDDPARRLPAKGEPAQPNQPAPGPRIAKPSSGDSSIPPVTLRGISPQRQADEGELNRLQTTGSGISQLQHKGGIKGALGTGLRVLSGIGSAVLPGVMAEIPGTDLHHDSLVSRSRNAVAGDIQNEERLGQTDLGAATTAHTNAETNALNNPQPKPKEEKWDVFAGYTDVDGTPLQREENSGTVVRASDKKPATGFKVAAPPKPTTTRDVTRLVNGVPHTVMVNAETGADIKDEGQTKVPGESPDQKRSAVESAQVERESRVNIRKAAEQYEGTKASVGQLISSIDAAKDGNGLLTSFVPTMEVLGINASNGVHRISPAEAQAANLPGGFVERFNAYFDKASTGQLSPQLQAEGKQLAQILLKGAYSRYKSTYDNENGIVTGYGGTGFDKRVPLIQEEQGGGDTQSFTENGITYDIPAEKVAAFKLKHPNASPATN